MKKDLTTIILVAIFAVGLRLLLYPSVSNYWNSFHQTQAVANYVDAVADLNTADYEKMHREASEYNKELAKGAFNLNLSKAEMKRYDKILDVTGTGIMGYVEVPSIRCTLPIYHGTDEGVLEIAIGHIAGTSFPIGGKSTHCVLSGHRGLPSAKLFSELDQLKEGDLFMLRTLDETLTYEVDQILIVLPEETEALKIEKGKDLCTLITCTPYGVNTHRLLVRGHRVGNVNDDIRVTADALQIAPEIVAPVVAAPMLLALLIWLLVTTRKPSRRKITRGDSGEKE